MEGRASLTAFAIVVSLLSESAVTDIDMIVTDVRPSAEWMAYFAEKGIKCVYGEENHGNSFCQ